LLRSLLATAVRRTEALVRPQAARRALKTKNYLLPQFPSPLGNAMHATPIVEALKAAEPEARIIVAASGFGAQVFRNNPNIERLIEVPNPVADLRGSVRAIRKEKLFDGQPFITLLTTGNERTNITLWATFAGPSRRVGFAVLPELLHDGRSFDRHRSQIENNLSLLSVAGLAAAMTEPCIYPTRSMSTDAEVKLQALGSAPGNRRIAMVTQTSPTQHKSWRAERWIQLAHHLIEQQKADLIFVGTEKESAAIDELRGRIGHPTISVAGGTSIAELAAVFTCCDLGVTLDTGPLHVGRGVGLPMVVIAPAWSPPLEWLPVGNPNYRIFKNADIPAPAPAGYIIDEVSLDEVIEAVHDLMERSPAADRMVRAGEVSAREDAIR
jgi:ADP-heptose:LPS heptosyltransferase